MRPRDTVCVCVSEGRSCTAAQPLAPWPVPPRKGRSGNLTRESENWANAWLKIEMCDGSKTKLCVLSKTKQKEELILQGFRPAN